MYEDMLGGRAGSSGVVAELIEPRGLVSVLQEKGRSLKTKGRSRWQWRVVDEIGPLLWKQLLPERMKFLEEMCETDAEVVEDSYSIYIFKALHSTQLRCVKTFENVLDSGLVMRRDL